MRRSHPHATRAAVVLVCAFFLSACTGGGTKALVASSPLSGERRATSSVLSSTCEAESTRGLTPSQGPNFIDQAGESFLIRAEGCCGDLPWGTGSVDGLDVSYHVERSYDPTPGCTLHIQEFGSGRLVVEGIRGEASLTVSSFGDCGPGFPCEIRSGFALDRCVESCRPVCLLIVCPPES